MSNSALDALYRHPLWKFLGERSCNKSSDATITGMGELNGKWLITNAEYPKFLDLLND